MPQRDAGALMRHIIKQRQLLDAARAPSDATRMTQTRIYVGLNDAQTGEQLLETDRYMEILKEICRDCRTPFSVDVEEGGYFHEDGRYTEEVSFVLVLIDAERDAVKKIAKTLCDRFGQESVLVTEEPIRGYFLKGG